MKPKLKFGGLDIALSAMLVVLLLVNLWIYIVAPARRVVKEEPYESGATYTAALRPAYTASLPAARESSPTPTPRLVLSDTELEQMLQGVWLSPPTQEDEGLLILCFHGAVIGQSLAVPLVEGADYNRWQEEDQWEGDGWGWFDVEIGGGSIIVNGKSMEMEVLSQDAFQLDIGDGAPVTLYRDCRGEVGLDAFLLGGWVSQEEIMDDGRHQALYFYPYGDLLLHRAQSNGADFDSWAEWEVSDVISAHGFETTGWEVMTHLMDGERVDISIEIQNANTILAANTDGSNPTVFLRVLSVQALPVIS